MANLASVWRPARNRIDEDASETELVARAKVDPNAFALLYRRYFDPIYRYCLRRLEDAEAAEDATSVVFTRAFEGLQRCDDAAFRSWLFAIAHNVVADRYRDRRPTWPLDEAAEFVDARMTPEDFALAADDARSLAALLEQLSPDQRQVVELRLAGLKGAEIARVLGRSHDAVKKLQGRAILRLRDLMGVHLSGGNDE